MPENPLTFEAEIEGLQVAPLVVAGTIVGIREGIEGTALEYVYIKENIDDTFSMNGVFSISQDAPVAKAILRKSTGQNARIELQNEFYEVTIVEIYNRIKID